MQPALLERTKVTFDQHVVDDQILHDVGVRRIIRELLVAHHDLAALLHLVAHAAVVADAVADLVEHREHPLHESEREELRRLEDQMIAIGRRRTRDILGEQCDLDPIFEHHHRVDEMHEPRSDPVARRQCFAPLTLLLGVKFYHGHTAPDLDRLTRLSNLWCHASHVSSPVVGHRFHTPQRGHFQAHLVLPPLG